jgi:hypothetical protein
MSYSEADTYRFYDKDFYPNDHSMGLFESDEYYQDSYSFNVALQNENHGFDPSPLFEKVQNEEKTEKEKSNQVTESKQKTDPTSKSLESLSVSDNESEVKEKKLLGRKIKGDTEKRKHDKFRPDNKMRKVKSNFVNLLPDYVNSSLSMEHPKFLKISKDVNEELGVDYNKNLMNQSLREIFSQNSINGRYSKKNFSKSYNADLVEEIYEKNEELEAIEKLNQTYIQVLDYYRKNNFEQFKNYILDKEIKNGEDRKTAIKYADELADLLFGY